MYDVKIIADSITEKGNRLTTFEVELPKYLVAEFNTHREKSRNSASSRAIPVKTMIKDVINNDTKPKNYFKNQSGMQPSSEKLGFFKTFLANSVYYMAKYTMIFCAWAMSKLGVHKQWSNRFLEPFMVTKIITSATEWDNFIKLRAHNDAQEEIKIIAYKIKDLLIRRTPMLLKDGEWHLPYINITNTDNGKVYSSNGETLTLEEAKRISVSCCAQGSYRKLDTSKSKAIKVYNMLTKSEIPHASPFEHQATPLTSKDNATHITIDGELCSGNFKGWQQLRHTDGTFDA